MSRSRTIAAVAVLAALSVVLGIVWLATRGEERFNLLLITLDTTRADRLGCYGYEAALTPNLDELSAAGVLFEQAFCSVPITLPSHATLLTGLHPPEHGIRVNGADRLDPTLPTLAQNLRQNGYRTAAFIAAFALDSKFGLDGGFDVYDDDMSAAYEQVMGEPYSVYRSGDRVTDAALAWLDTNATEPFFCWVHLYDPHLPYYQHAALAGTRFAGQRSYDAEVTFMDLQVGRLIALLRQRKLRQRTLVVAVGDHGEGLGDHWESAHGYMLYDSTLRVPLIFSQPKRIPTAARTPASVSLVDLSATILDLLEVPASSGQLDRSFKSAVLNRPFHSPPVYAETDLPYTDQGWCPLRCLITDRWKYIRTARVELYDRLADPAEANNLAEAQPDVVAQLETGLADLEDRMTRHASQPVDLTADEVRQLEALGYAGGAGDRTTDQMDLAALPDVKDMLPLRVLDGRRQALIMLGRLDEALEVSRETVRRWPESAEVWLHLGETLRSAGRVAEAEEPYRRAIRLEDSAAAQTSLGLVLAGTGRVEEAINCHLRALELEPNSADAHYNLARARAAQQDFDRSAAQYREVLELQPDRLDALNALAWLLATHDYFGGSDADQAVKLAQRACELTDYREPAVLDTLAAAYASAGQFAQAAQTAQQALDIASSRGQTELADEIRPRLQLYQAGQAYRQRPTSPASVLP